MQYSPGPRFTLMMAVAFLWSACASQVGATDAANTEAGSDVLADIAIDHSVSTRVPMRHRPNADPCPTTRPAGMCSFMGGPGTPCMVDGDCTMGTNGRCLNGMGGPAGCQCSYDTCHQDSDCTAGQLCACRGGEAAGSSGPNVCLMSECRVDADCGAGGYCSPSRTGGCGGITGFYCRTGNDLCVDDSDCADAGSFVQCSFRSENHRWECVQQNFCP